jgi:glutaredoxin
MGKDFDYVSVISDRKKLESMLKYSNGARKIPVIVEQGKVTIGFDGKT